MRLLDSSRHSFIFIHCALKCSTLIRSRIYLSKVGDLLKKLKERSLTETALGQDGKTINVKSNTVNRGKDEYVAAFNKRAVLHES